MKKSKGQYMQEAWDWLWAEAQKLHAAGWDGYSYLSATDVHRRVRAAIYEDLKGMKHGEAGRDVWGCRMRVTGFDLGDVRSWLFGQVMAGVLREDNPSGRRTCSGTRFRPASMELTEAERKTTQRKVKEQKAREEGTKPVHLRDGDGYPGKALCTKAARKAARAKGGYMGRPSRSSTLTTKDVSKVTCQRCLLSLALQVAAEGNWTDLMVCADHIELERGWPTVAGALRTHLSKFSNLVSRGS